MSEKFYVVKYSKGSRGYLVRHCKIKNIQLSELQKIFDIDPNDPCVENRMILGNYDITAQQAEKLKPFINFKFDFDKYKYQICGQGHKQVLYLSKVKEEDIYFEVCEYTKLIPWRFIDEYELDVNLDFLRKVFWDVNEDPTDYGFEPKINLKKQYAIDLQPYVSFKFELDKYDYWLQKREEGVAREIGGEDEEFIG